jgi:hypothetical protein
VSERKSFAAFSKKKATRKGGCPRCDDGTPNVGAVGVELRQLKESGQMAGRLDGLQRSLCEPCAVEVYEAMLALLETETKVRDATTERPGRELRELRGDSFDDAFDAAEEADRA